MSIGSPCAGCPHFSEGFCGAVLGNSADAASEKRPWQHHRVVAEGKQIISRNQPTPDVFVLCGGWGLRFFQLADGRKQILSILLSGDLFSVGSVLQERGHFSVKALTPVQVSGMRREEVQSRLAKSPAGIVALAQLSALELETSDGLAAVLGRCSAEERVAYLFLHLTRRLTARNG